VKHYCVVLLVRSLIQCWTWSAYSACDMVSYWFIFWFF